MSPSSLVWTVLGVLLAAAAAALLIRRARQGDAASGWLAVATVAWGAAFAAQGASAGDVTPAVIQLTLTDLLALLGLPPLVLGLLRLAPPAAQDGQIRMRRVSDPGYLLDAGLLVLAVFSVGWIAVLRSAYTASAVGPGFFTVDLIHPVADVMVLIRDAVAGDSGRASRADAIPGLVRGDSRRFRGGSGARERHAPWLVAPASLARGLLLARCRRGTAVRRGEQASGRGRRRGR